MICKHKAIKLNSCKFTNKTSVICLHTVKGPNCSISNNSIYHKSFIHIKFKSQTVLFDS